MNNTVDDLSPVFDYQPAGAWSQHNSNNDLTAGSYFQSTFSRTRRIGANATISFSGTSIAILGAQNGDNGTHTVFIDGKQVAAGPTLGKTIFSTSDLPSGWHTVTVTNGENTTGLTIDQVVWTPQAVAEDSTYVDDGDPAFQYNPANTWSTSSPDFKLFRNGTGHRTVTQGAQVQYTFEVWDSISVYGTVGPNYGPYGVSVDQQAAQTYVAQKQVTASTLLFFTNGLGQGNHTVTITNQDSRLLDIDYAVIGRMSSAALSPAPSSTTGYKGLPAGALVGIIFGVIGVIALSILAVVYHWTNKKLIKKLEDDQMAPNQFDTLGTANTIHGPDVVGFYPPSAKEKLAILDAGDEPGHGSVKPSAARQRSVDSSASTPDTLVAEDKFRHGDRPNQQNLAPLPLDNEISSAPGTNEEPQPVMTPASTMTALPRYSQMTQRPCPASSCIGTPQVDSPTATPTTPFNWAGASWCPKVAGVSEEESVLASTYHSPEEGSVLKSASRHDYGSSGLDGEGGHS